MPGWLNALSCILNIITIIIRPCELFNEGHFTKTINTRKIKQITGYKRRGKVKLQWNQHKGNNKPITQVLSWNTTKDCNQFNNLKSLCLKNSVSWPGKRKSGVTKVVSRSKKEGQPYRNYHGEKKTIDGRDSKLRLRNKFWSYSLWKSTRWEIITHWDNMGISVLVWSSVILV